MAVRGISGFLHPSALHDWKISLDARNVFEVFMTLEQIVFHYDYSYFDFVHYKLIEKPW